LNLKKLAAIMARGFYVFFVFVFCLLTSAIKGQVRAELGVIDARYWNFENARLPLNGQWVFFENKLLAPADCEKQKGELQMYPSVWMNPEGPGVGYGTYYLRVVMADSSMMLALEIPQLYNSYVLWVDGKRVASAGTIGTTPEASKPQWIYQTTAFHHSSDTLRVVLQIANFDHYKGGARESIYLGSPNRIIKHKLWAFGSNIAEVVLLFAIGTVFLIFYMLYRDKKVILYFSLLCLTWSVRAAFSNLYPITHFFPNFNWTLLVKVEYITLYGGMLWSIFFLHALFRNIRRKLILYVLVGSNVSFFLFALVTPPIIFSHWVGVYLGVAAITVLYAAFIIIRALLDGQAGALFLLISLLLGALVFGYDIIAYGSSSYNLVSLHFGYIVIFILVTIAMLLHLGIVKGHTKYSNVLTYKDMFGDGGNGSR
jgi:hypothetical protein